MCVEAQLNFAITLSLFIFVFQHVLLFFHYLFEKIIVEMFPFSLNPLFLG
jgi:hypothetical protein